MYVRILSRNVPHFLQHDHIYAVVAFYLNGIGKRHEKSLNYFPENSNYVPVHLIFFTRFLPVILKTLLQNFEYHILLDPLNFSTNRGIVICDALRDLVPFVQF